MTTDQQQKLREAALAAARAVHEPARDSAWAIQTSNSHRRIGTTFGDGNVLCAVTQRSDGHPDLHARPEVLEYIIATQPRVVLDLLDQLASMTAARDELLDWATPADRRHERKDGYASELLPMYVRIGERRRKERLVELGKVGSESNALPEVP